MHCPKELLGSSMTADAICRGAALRDSWHSLAACLWIIRWLKVSQDFNSGLLKWDVENKETVQYEGCSRVWSTIDLHVLDWWKVNDEHGSHRREFLQTVLESKTPAYAFAAHLKKSKYIYILLIICAILLLPFSRALLYIFFLPCNDVAGILMDFAISKAGAPFP